MSRKAKTWIVIIWIIPGLTLFLSIICKPTSCPKLLLGDMVTFITHSDGRTEIILECINLSDFRVYGVEAEVVIRHMETKGLIDRVNARVGDIGSHETRGFSAWTDKLEFGSDVGVAAVFTYVGVG